MSPRQEYAEESLTPFVDSRDPIKSPKRLEEWSLSSFCEALDQKWTMFASYPQDKIRARFKSIGRSCWGQKTLNLVHVFSRLPCKPWTKTMLFQDLTLLMRNSRASHSTIASFTSLSGSESPVMSEVGLTLWSNSEVFIFIGTFQVVRLSAALLSLGIDDWSHRYLISYANWLRPGVICL